MRRGAALSGGAQLSNLVCGLGVIGWMSSAVVIGLDSVLAIVPKLHAMAKVETAKALSATTASALFIDPHSIFWLQLAPLYPERVNSTNMN